MAGADDLRIAGAVTFVPGSSGGTALPREGGGALVVLTVNAVSLAISFWSGDPRFMLAKDGAVTSILGLAILASVLARRPLMTAGMRPFVTRGNAAKEAAFGRLLDASARFRQLEARFSVIWAGVFLVGGVVADRIEKMVSAEVTRDQQREP